MADPANQRAVGDPGEVFEGGVPGLALGAGHANLDQFVIVQGPLGFGDDALADSAIAHQNHRLQGVGEPAQVTALFFGNLHERIVAQPVIITRSGGCRLRLPVLVRPGSMV